MSRSPLGSGGLVRTPTGLCFVRLGGAFVLYFTMMEICFFFFFDKCMLTKVNKSKLMEALTSVNQYILNIYIPQFTLL